jgi:hypothetical protein
MSSYPKGARSIPYPQGRRRLPRRFRIVAVAALMTVAGLTAYFSRQTILRGMADIWIVSSEVGPADAVVILGGGLETRPIAAADDYRHGLAKKVLVANIRITQPERLGIVPSSFALTRTALMKLGVAEADIETFGTEVSNTHEEAVALREWVVRSHAAAVIIPTEIFSARRVRWIMERILDGTGVKVQVQILSAPGYSQADWWQNENGIVSFQNEVLKYIYYRFKY